MRWTRARRDLSNPASDACSRNGITEQNLSLLRNGKVKGVRFGTLSEICAYLECQPGDLLVYEPDDSRDGQ